MKAIFSLALLFSFSMLSAQEIANKTICISGEASIQISPDEIILRIAYDEYWNTPKKLTKINIKTIEKKILSALKEAGVKDSNITLGAVRLLRDYNRVKSVYENRRLSKSLNVCVYHAKEIEKLIEILEAKGLLKKAISQFSIASLRHTNKEKFETQAKIEAIKNAREKASLLLNTLGKNIGEVIQIKEVKTQNNQQANESFYSSQSTNNSGVSLITINYSVEVIFEIK